MTRAKLEAFEAKINNDPKRKQMQKLRRDHVQYLTEDDHRGAAVARNVPEADAPKVAEAMQFFGLYIDVVQHNRSEGVVTLWTKGYRHHDSAPEATPEALQALVRDPKFYA